MNRAVSEAGGEADGDDDDKPVHEVRLTKPFCLGVHEATNAQWQAVMGKVPSQLQEADRPVEQVCWDDAVEACRQSGRRSVCISCRRTRSGSMRVGWARRRGICSVTTRQRERSMGVLRTPASQWIRTRKPFW